MTRNFMQTVRDSNSLKMTENVTNFEYYLRPVNAAIQFDKSSVLLRFPECEADSIQLLLWKRQLLNNVSHNSILGFSFLKNALHAWNSRRFPLQLHLCDDTTSTYAPKCLSSSAAASVQLFSRDPMFAEEAKLALISEILNTSNGKPVALLVDTVRATDIYIYIYIYIWHESLLGSK